jgi:hypothetical protein
MATPIGCPTTYPEVNARLRRLRSEAERILGPRFVGLYLYGSLALGDFMPGRSDIDFLIATTDEIPPAQLEALRAMHMSLEAEHLPWPIDIEGSYIPVSALRRRDPAHSYHPHIDRGGSGLHVESHDSDWVIQRFVLREWGVVVAGPPLADLIDPMPPQELRAAVLELLHLWWAPMLVDPSPLLRPRYQDYAVLTMCRILYTLQTGSVVSKPVAARWAQAALAEPWAALIERAVSGRSEPPEDTLAETQAIIHYTARRHPL